MLKHSLCDAIHQQALCSSHCADSSCRVGEPLKLKVMKPFLGCCISFLKHEFKTQPRRCCQRWQRNCGGHGDCIGEWPMLVRSICWRPQHV